MNKFNAISLGAIALALLSVSAHALPTTTMTQESTERDGRVSTAMFGVQPFMQTPKVSPDGNKIAVQLSYNGSTALSVVSLNDPTEKTKFLISAGEMRDYGDRDLYNYRWIGNDFIVASLASRESIFGTRGDVSRLIAINVNSGELKPLAWNDAGFSAANILHIDHDKETFLLQRDSTAYSYEMLGKPEVVEVDVTTGRFKVVRRPNVEISSWFSDADGIVRAGSGYDRDTGESRIMYRSKEGENFKTITQVVDEDFTGAGIQPLIFLDQPDMAIASSNRDGYRKFYKINMKDLALGKPIFASEGYDADGIISNYKGNNIYGFRVTEERQKSIYTDELFKVLTNLFEDQFGEGNARIVSYNKDRTRIIFVVGQTNQPGSYYLYNTGTGDVSQIGWVRDRMKGMELNPVSTKIYTTSDGEQVPAVVTMPRHRSGSKNLPAVIMPHGGPFGVRDEEEFGYFPWAQAMAELGYVVIQPNYRGSGGYGTEWLKKGRSEGFGLRMQDDLNDAVSFFASQDVIDADRVCMMGWSYGGYASARAAQRDSDKYRCAIAGAGVYDLSLMKRYDRDYLGKFGAKYLSEGAADLDTVSPAEHPEGDWSPILIVHGFRDNRVPIEQAETLVSALKSEGKQEGKDFLYIEQKENTHNFPYEEDHIQWLEAARDWLAKHNPAYLPSDPDSPPPVTVTLK